MDLYYPNPQNTLWEHEIAIKKLRGELEEVRNRLLYLERSQSRPEDDYDRASYNNGSHDGYRKDERLYERRDERRGERRGDYRRDERRNERQNERRDDYRREKQ